METMWLDEPEMESADYESEGAELYGDTESGDTESESYGGESQSAAARRRRAAARRVALARRRQALGRARSAARLRPGAPAPQPSAAAAIRNLDLETKVQEDSLRSAISAQRRRMSRSEYAAVASVATNQFIESFDEPDSPFFRAMFRVAPLLLLSPQKRGSGFEAFVKDPRVIGVAAVAAITVAGENTDLFGGSREIRILAPPQLAVNADATLIADVVQRGRVISDKVVWKSDDPGKATIDAASGKVTGVSAGFVPITASFDGVVTRILLEIK